MDNEAKEIILAMNSLIWSNDNLGNDIASKERDINHRQGEIKTLKKSRDDNTKQLESLALKLSTLLITPTLKSIVTQDQADQIGRE